MTFQDIILALEQFWGKQGCVIQQPYHTEVGAGTMNPATFFRALGPEPWRVAYVEPSIRPTDGRYTENPNRWQHYYQYQVIMKPSPPDIQDLYLQSLKELGIEPLHHDIRFVEDDWESPTLGAWGVGWEVWLDGMEITQFTYFQQVGGVEAKPVSVEITYGLERIAMYLQGVENFLQIRWVGDVTYGEIHQQGEIQFCSYNFELADQQFLWTLFNSYASEAEQLLKRCESIARVYEELVKDSPLKGVSKAIIEGACNAVTEGARRTVMEGAGRTVMEAARNTVPEPLEAHTQSLPGATAFPQESGTGANPLESEAPLILLRGAPLFPAYDCVLKCSHIFNLLEARGGLGVTERTNLMLRVRGLAKQCAVHYLAQRAWLGYPLAGKFAEQGSAQPRPGKPEGARGR